MGKRRFWLGFGLGVVATAIVLPLLAVAWLRLFWGINPDRTAAPAPFNQPDVSVSISRTYLEGMLASDAKFSNPVIELAPLDTGGAVMTLTVGFDFPLLGRQDTQSISAITAANGKLVVTTERIGLGEQGQLGVPGSVVERTLSAIITGEINKRLESTSLIIDVVRVRVTGDNEMLTVDAALRRPDQ